MSTRIGVLSSPRMPCRPASAMAARASQSPRRFRWVGHFGQLKSKVCSPSPERNGVTGAFPRRESQTMRAWSRRRQVAATGEASLRRASRGRCSKRARCPAPGGGVEDEARRPPRREGSSGETAGRREVRQRDGRARLPGALFDIGVNVVRPDTRLRLARAGLAHVDSAELARGNQPVDVHVRAAEALGRSWNRVKLDRGLCHRVTSGLLLWRESARWFALQEEWNHDVSRLIKRDTESRHELLPQQESDD